MEPVEISPFDSKTTIAFINQKKSDFETIKSSIPENLLPLLDKEIPTSQVLSLINDNFNLLSSNLKQVDEFFGFIFKYGEFVGFPAHWIQAKKIFKFEFEIKRIEQRFKDKDDIIQFLKCYNKIRYRNFNDQIYLNHMLEHFHTKLISGGGSLIDELFDALFDAVHKIFPFSRLYYAHVWLKIKLILGKSDKFNTPDVFQQMKDHPWIVDFLNHSILPLVNNKIGVAHGDLILALNLPKSTQAVRQCSQRNYWQL